MNFDEEDSSYFRMRHRKVQKLKSANFPSKWQKIFSYGASENKNCPFRRNSPNSSKITYFLKPKGTHLPVSKTQFDRKFTLSPPRLHPNPITHSQKSLRNFGFLGLKSLHKHTKMSFLSLVLLVCQQFSFPNNTLFWAFPLGFAGNPESHRPQ